MSNSKSPAVNWSYKNSKGNIVLDFNPVVFLSASVLIALFVILSLVYLDEFSRSVDGLQAWIANQTGWFFVLMVNVVLGYLLFLMIGPFGSIRLGRVDERPEFSRTAWFAMLFSAGMGIGLMFYSVAEPLSHLAKSPHGVDPGSTAAYQDAMKTTFLHWGLHAWGLYALTGLALAYFAFNRDQPLSFRTIFEPLLGDRIHGFWGHAIDVLATIATLFGVATSLGLGVSQVNTGLNHLFGVSVGSGPQIALIVGITLVATLSVVLGLDKGIKRISEFNMVLAIILLLFVLLIGPTLFIFNGFVENLGLYLDDFFALAFWNETYSQGDWQNDWTVFYWGWWAAWAPFVGMFIARISRGRSIREFIAGVLLVATGLTFIWLSVFGNSALFIELAGPGGLLEAVEEDLTRSLFVFFEKLPLATGLEIPSSVLLGIGTLAIVVIITFFVTSSDSGSLVIDIITAGGHPNPPVAQRIYWATTEGVVAAILLAGGGLAALQTAAIAAGLPFAVLILLMIYSLQRALTDELSKTTA
ncbi:MAG: BCCT family transporter [Methylococcales bacterium]|nr:BCCT family transporter [Methylococcales bacterium]